METTLKYPSQLFRQPVCYEIPPFQRRYVWDQDMQWEPLWNDVEVLAESIMDGAENEPHFMGAVVFQETELPRSTMESFSVVDGQQRLTTLQLLIDAIQEVLEAREHKGPAGRLSELVVNNWLYCNENPDLKFKVWPTVVDREAFRCAMSNELSTVEHTTSRVVHAHDFFRSEAERWLDQFVGGQGGQAAHAAHALEQAVSKKLQIVVINLAGKDDPHAIFETLNARGTPLLQSDMVKNKVLHDAEVGLRNGDEASEEEKHLWPFGQDEWWTQEVGRGLQRRPRIDVYLNHWLTLRNRSEMKPYDEFKAFKTYTESKKVDGATTKDTIDEVATDMCEMGDVYRDIEEIRKVDVAVAKFLKRRQVMNVGVVTPLLLWLLSEDLPTNTLANCVKALESFLVRRIICGYGARSYGELFVGLLNKLVGDSAGNADRVIISHLRKQEAQATLWPRDRELLEQFITAPLYRRLTRGRLRMVLSGIEEELRRNGDVPNGLHIEHVMPQAWRRWWPLPNRADNEADAIREEAIHTIGNLTLVNGRVNATLSNEPWDKKRRTLSMHSDLFLNKHLVRNPPRHWDEKAIKKRGKWLHKRAIKVWPRGDDVQAT